MESMFTGIVYTTLVLGIGIFLTIPFSSWIARLVGAIDLPGEIKVHTQPTPRLGGLGILLAFLLPVTGLLFAIDVPVPVYSQFIVVLALLVSLAICGYFDDVLNLTPSLRFAVEAIIGVILVSSVIGSEMNWLILVIGWFWIVGLINAYNFLDGLDGLAGSIATVNLFALAIMFFISGNEFLAIAASTLALATCGFLRYNWPPASIFMGDIGSLSLGFVISAFSLILVVNQNFSLNSIVAVTLVVILPLGDLIATVFRRLTNRKLLFQGDRGHFYDLLVDRAGLSKANAMKFSLFMALVFSGLGIIAFLLPVQEFVQYL